MTNHARSFALIAIALFPVATMAQRPTMPDAAQLAAMTANSAQMMKPAEFVLRHRADLGLTAKQVTALEALAVALTDSSQARMQRQVRTLPRSASSASSKIMVEWRGPVSEKDVRDAVRQMTERQVEMQVALMFGMARDRRRTAALLTPAQVAQLTSLQTSDMMNAVRRP